MNSFPYGTVDVLGQGKVLYYLACVTKRITRMRFNTNFPSLRLVPYQGYKDSSTLLLYHGILVNKRKLKGEVMGIAPINL